MAVQPPRKPPTPAAPAPIMKTAPAPMASTAPPFVSSAPIPPAAPPIPAPVAQAAQAAEKGAADMREQVRTTAEKTLEQSREAYSKMKAAAQETSHSVEQSIDAAAKGFAEFNAKAFEALKSNTDAAFDLMQKLVAAKSLSEAATLQTEFARKQVESMTAQTKTLAEIAKRVATDSAEPMKSAVTKAMTPH